MSNQNELVKELIKIANKLDKNGHYDSANDLTKIASDLSNIKMSANFFKDLGRTLRQEIQQGVQQRFQQQTRGFFDRGSRDEQMIVKRLDEMINKLGPIESRKRAELAEKINAAKLELQRLRGNPDRSLQQLLIYRINDLENEINLAKNK